MITVTAFRRRYVNTVRNSGASLHLQSVSKTNLNFPTTPFTAVLLQSDTNLKMCSLIDMQTPTPPTRKLALTLTHPLPF